MSLVEMWGNNIDGIQEKSLHQILAFAGEGKLSDGSICSREFRGLIGKIPLDKLRQYAADALNGEAESPGLAFQDIVNELGIRLGFNVEPGLYRGRQGESGHDGLWNDPTNHNSIIIEVKSTSAYRIKLSAITRYHEILSDSGKIKPNRTSALIIIGQKDEDTSDLEAQIRGSRHRAGDIRVVSLEGLFKMAALKEETDNPASARLLRGILIPKEYTKLDELLDVLNFVAQDVTSDDAEQDETSDSMVRVSKRDGAYVSRLDRESMRRLAMDAIKAKLGADINSISRSLYETKDGKIAICYTASKPYLYKTHTTFWFAFHDYHADFMKKHANGYLAYHCSGEGVVIIPWKDFEKHISNLGETTYKGRHWRHVTIRHPQGGGWKLKLVENAPGDPVDIAKWYVPITLAAKRPEK